MDNQTEILKLKNTVEKLQKEGNALKDLIEILPVGISITDPEGKIIESNIRSEELLGISKEEHTKRDIDEDIWKIIKPDGSEFLPEEYASVIALKEKKIVSDLIMGIVKNSGKVTWISVTATPLEIKDYGVIITYYEVTDLLETEKALKESEEQYRSLFENSPDIIFLADDTNHIFDANATALKVLGYSKEEVIGKYFNFVHPYNEDATEKKLSKIKEQISQKGFTDIDKGHLQTKDGLVLDVNYKVQKIIIGKKEYTQATFREYSNEEVYQLRTKRYNEASIKLIEMQTEEEIHEFVAETLHKLNPNTVIISNIVDEENKKTTTVQVKGLEGSIFDKSLNLLGYDIIGKEFDLIENHFVDFRSGKLIKFQGGLSEFAAGQVPAKIANSLEKLFKISNIYSIGITRSGKAFSLIHFFSQHNTEIIDIANIENFINQVALVLEKKQLEKEIKTNEEKYRLMVETSPDIIILANPDTGIIYDCNHTALEKLGYEKDELIGKHQSFLHPKEELDAISKSFQVHIDQLKEKGYSEVMNVNLITKSGEIIYTQNQAQIIKIKDNILIQGAFRDIGEKLKAEQALAESEERYRLLSDLTFEGIILHKNGVAIDVNESILKLTKAKKEDIIGANVIDKFVIARETSKVKSKVKNRDESLYETVMEDNLGNKIPIEIQSRDFTYKGEELRVSAIRDITERKQAEQALAESEERYRLLSDLTIEGVIIHDEGVAIEINESLANMIGQDKEDILGRNVIKEFIAPEELPKIAEKFKQKHVEPYETIAKTPDGTLLPIEVEGRAIRYKGKDLRVASIRDITQRITNEQASRKAKTDLEEALRTKDKFLSIIAHDLRSPFSGFLGLAKMLTENMDELTVKELREITAAINSSAENLYELLENLLQWSRTQLNSYKYEPDYLRIFELIENNLKLYDKNLKEKNITIKKSINDGLFGYFDADMIDSVIRNLLSNAIKFSFEGSEIVVSTHAELDYLYVSIQDFGYGIKEEDIKKIVKIDESYSRPGTKNEKGSGLGLVLSFEFMKINKGELLIESTYGEGSTFTMKLPTKKSE